MKILNREQIQYVDQQTVLNLKISSWELMEIASKAVVEELIMDYKNIIFKVPVNIICGKGNNGGDGLALARLLRDIGVKVHVFVIRNEKYSPDNLLNQIKFNDFKYIDLDSELVDVEEGLLIDCLFGIGLNSPLSTEWYSLINQINQFQGEVISIDMPSGLLCQTSMPSDSIIVKAKHVYTFQTVKLSLILPENKNYIGDFKVLNIGIDKSLLKEQQSNYFYLEKTDVIPLVQARGKFTHKGTFGHSLIVGGSFGMMGSVVLSTKAALRMGAGLVSAMVPGCGVNIVQVSVPEVIIQADSSEKEITHLTILDFISATGIGIGMGKSQQTIKAFAHWMENLKGDEKIIFDADALNILAIKPKLLECVPRGSIFSPHPKELARLIGPWENDYDKLKKAKEFAIKYGIVMIIKGAHSAILDMDGDIYFNSTGNPGMATAGSGDVLTGMLTSLRSQGYSPLHSSLLAVYIHGCAGDYMASIKSQTCLIASDIIEGISHAFILNNCP